MLAIGGALTRLTAKSPFNDKAHSDPLRELDELYFYSRPEYTFGTIKAKRKVTSIAIFNRTQCPLHRSISTLSTFPCYVRFLKS